MSGLLSSFAEDIKKYLKRNGLSLWTYFRLIVFIDFILFLFKIDTRLKIMKISETSFLTNLLWIFSIISIFLYIIIQTFKNYFSKIRVKWFYKFQVVSTFLIYNLLFILVFIYISNFTFNRNTFCLTMVLSISVFTLFITFLKELNMRSIDDPIDNNTFYKNFLTLASKNQPLRQNSNQVNSFGKSYVLAFQSTMFPVDGFKYVIFLSTNRNHLFVRGFDNYQEAKDVFDRI